MGLPGFVVRCFPASAKVAGGAIKAGHVARASRPVRRAVGAKAKASGAASLAAKGAMLAAGAGAVGLVCTRVLVPTPLDDAAPAIRSPYGGPVGGFWAEGYGLTPSGGHAPSAAGFAGFPAVVSAGGHGLIPAVQAAPLPRELCPILTPIAGVPAAPPAAAPGPVPADRGAPQDVPEPASLALLGAALIGLVAARKGLK